MVGGLVEQQKVRRRDKNARQGEAIALAAGEHAELLEDVVAGEEEAAEERTEFLFGHLERGAADVVEHARVGVEHLVLVLREVLADHVVAEFDVAGGGLLHAGEQLDERGFAGAVDAHQRNAVAALDGEARIGEDVLRPIALGEPFGFDNHAAGGRRLREFEVDDRLFLWNLDALDFVEFLNAGLDLLGLGGLRAEAIDKGFEVLDLIALIFVGSQQLRAALVFLREVFGVVALEDGEALVPDFDGAVDGDVEKIAVVRDEDVAEGIGLQIVLKPVAGFEVEMVGGLVEQQQVGPRQQQLGQRDAHLPAARKFLGVAGPVLFAKAKAGEHGAYLRVERVAIKRVKALLQQREAFGGGFVLRAGVVQLGKLSRGPLHFAFHGAQLVEDGEALVKDGTAGQLQAFLRQVANAHALGLLHHAIVQQLEAGQDLHERGFAGAIGADQCGFFACTDKPVGLKEENTRAEAFAGFLEREHSSIFAEHLRCGCIALRANLHRRAHGNEIPDFVHLVVRDGDAAQGPVVEAMRGAKCAHAVGKAVNHDGSTGSDARGCGSFAVGCIGIGDVQSLVVVAVLVAGVDGVVAFGRAGIALALLGSKSPTAQSNLIGANDLAAGDELEQMVLFENQDGIGLLRRWSGRARRV